PDVVGHTGPIAAAAFLADGGTVATISYDRTIRVWDGATGRELRRFPFGEHWWTQHFAASADGRWLVATGMDRSSRSRAWLLDAQTGHAVQTLDHGNHAIQGLAFAPGGRRLVTVSAPPRSTRELAPS